MLKNKFYRFPVKSTENFVKDCQLLKEKLQKNQEWLAESIYMKNVGARRRMSMQAKSKRMLKALEVLIKEVPTIS